MLSFSKKDICIESCHHSKLLSIQCNGRHSIIRAQSIHCSLKSSLKLLCIKSFIIITMIPEIENICLSEIIGCSALQIESLPENEAVLVRIVLLAQLLSLESGIKHKKRGMKRTLF